MRNRQILWVKLSHLGPLLGGVGWGGEQVSEGLPPGGRGGTRGDAGSLASTSVYILALPLISALNSELHFITYK